MVGLRRAPVVKDQAAMTLASSARTSNQVQALVQASLALTTEPSLERVLQKIAEVARDVLRARYAALGVIDERGTGLSQFLTVGIDDAGKAAIGPLPMGQGVLGLLISERRPIRIRRLAEDPRSAGFPANHPPMESFLGVPIMVRDKTYGNLYVTEKQGGGEFSEADEQVALMLASQAGIGIENALTFRTLSEAQDELNRRERVATELNAQMQALMQASLALTTEPSLERVLQKIAEVARDVLRARYAALGVIDERGTGLSQFLTAGIDEAGKAAIGPLPTGQGVLGLLISERRPIRIRRLAAHPRSAGFPANHPPMESFLGVPIMVRDKAYGNLYVTEKQGGEFSETDEQVALMLASQAAIAIEHAQAFRALAETQEELLRKEKLAMLGQLAGGVGHELRNPLGVMKNSVYYLEMILPEEARARKHLGILDREVGTANRIVSDLLEFARMKSASRSLIDLKVVVSDLLERLPVPETVAVAWEMPDGLSRVSADRLHVEQILTNLITNAVQAMPDGGALTIAGRDEPAGVVLSVTDTGIAIRPEDLPKIFQPLFTTKPKGIGLGLAVARDLADANRAVITVESTQGVGSRFAVRFERPDEP
jgi:signal transduction histidine kinase